MTADYRCSAWVPQSKCEDFDKAFEERTKGTPRKMDKQMQEAIEEAKRFKKIGPTIFEDSEESEADEEEEETQEKEEEKEEEEAKKEKESRKRKREEEKEKRKEEKKRQKELEKKKREDK